MVDTNLVSQYNIQAGILVVTCVVWLACGLSALSGYLGFRQRLDLGWAGAFAVLAIARALDAFTAWKTAGQMDEMRIATASVVEFLGYYQVRIAAIEMVAAFFILVLFRSRHLFVRRPAELT